MGKLCICVDFFCEVFYEVAFLDLRTGESKTKFLYS